MAFDGTPKVIDACRERQHEFKALAGDQGHPLLRGAGRPAGIRHHLDPRVGKQGTLKAVCFPALIPHDEVHGLPGPHVNPSRRESKIIHDDGRLLVLGGAAREAQQEDCQAFDRSQAPC